MNIHEELPKNKSGDEAPTSPERREELPSITFYRKHNVISESTDPGGLRFDYIEGERLGPAVGYHRVDCIHNIEFIDGQWQEKSSRRVTYESIKGKDWRENKRDVSERYACSDPDNKDKIPLPVVIEGVAVVGRDATSSKVLREMSQEELNTLVSSWKRDRKPPFVNWNN